MDRLKRLSPKVLLIIWICLYMIAYIAYIILMAKSTLSSGIPYVPNPTGSAERVFLLFAYAVLLPFAIMIHRYAKRKNAKIVAIISGVAAAVTGLYCICITAALILK